jgi:hypothetical protein
MRYPLSLIFVLTACFTACSGAPPVPDKPDPVFFAQVQATLRKRDRDVQSCYDNEPGNLKNKPSGVIMIQFVVGAKDGKLIGAAIEGAGTTLDEPDVANCLLDLVVSTRFAPPRTQDGRDLQVHYPFIFNAAALPKGGDHP